MPSISYCNKHPDTATSIRCSRCEIPVCPQCLVHAAVGIRCQDCGKTPKLPTYDVSTALTIRALLTSVLIGLIGGLSLVVLSLNIIPGFIYLAAMAGLGYLISESVSLVSHHKRGTKMQIASATGAITAGLTSTIISVVLFGNSPILDLLGTGLACYIAIIRLR